MLTAKRARIVERDESSTTLSALDSFAGACIVQDPEDLHNFQPIRNVEVEGLSASASVIGVGTLKFALRSRTFESDNHQ